jgi:hypothetical protein
MVWTLAHPGDIPTWSVGTRKDKTLDHSTFTYGFSHSSGLSSETLVLNPETARFVGLMSADHLSDRVHTPLEHCVACRG